MPNELTVLRKKVNEVEDALKMCNDSKEVMKDQLRVLEQKVEILQKTKGLSISNNGDKEETTSERFKCRNCDKTFPSIKSLRRHVSSSHEPKIECNSCDKIFS